MYGDENERQQRLAQRDQWLEEQEARRVAEQAEAAKLAREERTIAALERIAQSLEILAVCLEQSNPVTGWEYTTCDRHNNDLFDALAMGWDLVPGIGLNARYCVPNSDELQIILRRPRREDTSQMERLENEPFGCPESQSAPEDGAYDPPGTQR